MCNYLKRSTIKYKQTTISVKYYLLEKYAHYLCYRDGDVNTYRIDYYQKNKKFINTNLSQYVDYWIYHKTIEFMSKELASCEKKIKLKGKH